MAQDSASLCGVLVTAQDPHRPTTWPQGPYQRTYSPGKRATPCGSVRAPGHSVSVWRKGWQPERIHKGMKWSLNPTQLRVLRLRLWHWLAALKGAGRGCEQPPEEVRCSWGCEQGACHPVLPHPRYSVSSWGAVRVENMRLLFRDQGARGGLRKREKLGARVASSKVCASYGPWPKPAAHQSPSSG